MRLFCLLLAVSCAHTPTTVEVFGPDGESYSTSCKAIEDCYNEAHRVCEGEYKILDSSSRSSHQVIPNGANPVVITHTSNKILYSCK